MEIGELNKRVELQHLAENKDDFGEMIRSYAPYAKVWAKIEPLQGRELEHAQQISTETTHRVTIRYKANVASEHRVIYKERIFEIEVPLNPGERNEYLVLMCKEIS
jgi:SPP1 family predicted phage head-tail adaptor